MDHAAAVDLPSVGLRSCLFCRFDDSTMNTVLSETPNFYARLDNFPAAEGHVEIVPKRHILSFFEIDPDEVREMYALMTDVRAKLEEKYRPNGYTIGVNEGRAAGRTVDHLHVHLIPRYDGDVSDPRGGIRRIFPDCDPDAWSSPTGS